MSSNASRNTWSSKLSKWLPHAALALALLYALSALRPVSDDGAFRLSEFGRLPVVDQGRIKPLDTLARISLMVLSNKQVTWSDGHGSVTSNRSEKAGHHKMPALRWMLDVMTKPEQSRSYRVVRIDHPDVLALLGVKPEERQYFSVHEIMHEREVINDQIERARTIPANEQSSYHRALMRLSQQLGTYFGLEDVASLILIPPALGTGEWRQVREAQSSLGSEMPPEVEAYVNALSAWNEQRPGDFNAAVMGYTAELDAQFPGLMGKVKFEQYFNHVAPFLKAMGLYVLAFVIAIFSWLRTSRNLSNASLWVLLVAIVIHTAGLVARIYIQGRPPVTNLYSSAVFVGWGAVILGIVLERLYRNGIGAVTAATTGFLTLLVAHNLSLDGDTMTMMQAVLDTNFWLATHVTVITLGYSATFLAGFLGILYILRGVFTKSLTRDMARSLSRMIYGIVCFAALFSFVGTILGGIWADQSWGRFWGWDPKENGALLIVLWNALVLHARWGGMARQRGIAALAVGGNIVTAWSWFGTNMLGVGLHAYGFIDSAIFWMMMFVLSQLAIIAIAMLPPEKWRSSAAMAKRTGPKPRPTKEELPAAT